MDCHIYFHCPCFDGIASTVLLCDFLRKRRSWDKFELLGVNYHLRNEWLTTPLRSPSAVVDFLYHPAADIWADHHPTSFLTEEMEARFATQKDSFHVYEPTAKSCAGMLWDHLWQAFGHRSPRFEPLVLWAEKTDSADYVSVKEAIFGNAPALRIAKALAGAESESLCATLIRQLETHSLEEVADLPEVQERYERTRSATEAGLERFEGKLKVDDDEIAQFDVDATGVSVNRYAPFLYSPDARYSLGIVRGHDHVKITAMRNPWMDFPSIHLGRIFETVGGGGHQRVGSVVLRGDRIDEAPAIAKQLLAEMRALDESPHGATSK